VSRNPDARARWEAELLARGYQPSGVPTAILGDRVWIGFDDRVATEISASVASLVAVAGSSEAAGDGSSADDAEAAASATRVDPVEPGQTTITIPLVGEVELAGRSAIGITALIAFVDGFNPCSLWVLAILLAMVLNAGATRARVIAVGVTFLAVTGLIYGAFIVGVFTVVDLLSSVAVIGWVVGAIALLVGAVNIKDYFAYKQGLSFTIPDRFKPRIYRGGRAIRDHERPLPAVLATTVVLAAGVSLVEIPCTMGFPVIWTGLIQTMGIGRGTEFAGLLGLYLLIYVGLELVLFGVVVVTMQVVRMDERHGRALKLVGGSLMVVLGVAMIWFQTLLDDLTGLLILTLTAVGLAGVLLLINRARGGNGTGSGPDRPQAPSGRSATSGRR
jgi:cytochrome c biogenesis protein CcdA